VPRKRSLASTYTAVLLFALALAIPAVAQGSAAARSAVRLNRSNIRIDNFGQVSPTYVRGGQPQGQDYADLAAVGVKTVIDLTSDDGQAGEKAMVERAGMTYVRIPMTTHESPSQANVAQFLSLVDDARRQPVYVHCVGGRHRTGVMTAIYRMTDEGWSADKAFAEMKQYKFGADFLHSEFKQFVYGYHADTNARAATVATIKAGS
jgi:protein tyrosine/serine phosphatase